MILPLVDGNGQTQLVVIDRATQLARDVLTGYFEDGTITAPVFAAPVVEPVVVPAPFVAPVPVVEPVPIEFDEKKTHHKKAKKFGHVLESAAKGLKKDVQAAKKKTEKVAKKVEKDVKKEVKAVEKKVESKKMEVLTAAPNQQLPDEVLLGLEQIKAAAVNIAAQFKNTIELHAHEVAKPVLEGLFDIAKTSTKIASSVKDHK